MESELALGTRQQTLYKITYSYICSALSRNLRFLQIAQRFLRIPRKRANVQIGALSGNPQMALHFLGIPKWRSTFWGGYYNPERDRVSTSLILRVHTSIRSSGKYNRCTRDVVTHTTGVLEMWLRVQQTY